MEKNTYQLIDGNKLKEKILNRLKEEVSQMKSEGKKSPHLVLVHIGDDPASALYIKMKSQACDYIGITFSTVHFDTISTKGLLSCIDSLNTSQDIDAILVQLPLPPHIETDQVIESIKPEKDVDGFHPYNVGKLWQSMTPYFFPCTALGVYRLLEEYNLKLEGKKVLILNRSNIVGKPLAAMLSQKTQFGDATVTIAHSKTKNLIDELKSADVLITGIGSPNFIDDTMIKPGAIIIDVGISIVFKDGKKRIFGDVNFEKVAPYASYITPVPGGVGAMTVAILMENIVKAKKIWGHHLETEKTTPS